MIELWGELKHSERISLIEGFRSRLNRCLQAKGDLIKMKG
jgi:hypothetical protein